MQHKGTIQLMFDNCPIRSLYYYSVKRRKEIIVKWSLEYGEKFNHCSLQIVPYSDPGRVKEDGNNFGNGKRK